jgi:hypothetical protein
VEDPVPLPQEPLSQSAFVWHDAPPPCAHVPLLEFVPLPQEPLSQSAFLWQVALLVLHVPLEEPLPLPQVPLRPQSASLWQLVPPLQVPSLEPPPHVPVPQSALVWQEGTLLQDPPPQVPAPHCELDVQAIGVQVALLQVLPPPQSEFDEHEHTPFWQTRPPPQSRSRVQPAAWQVPRTAPAQVKLELGQSTAVRHGSEHCPTEPSDEPMQTAVKPQSLSVRHWLVLPMSALAETWKSLYTTRPHWFAADAPHGVLNVNRLV